MEMRASSNPTSLPVPFVLSCDNLSNHCVCAADSGAETSIRPIYTPKICVNCPVHQVDEEQSALNSSNSMNSQDEHIGRMRDSHGNRFLDSYRLQRVQ